MRTEDRTRNKKILARAGKKSYGLIAKELGLTKGIVAGVIWRKQWPFSKRKKLGQKATTPNGGAGNFNKCGNGYRTGEYAPRTMKLGRPYPVKRPHGRPGVRV